jgi:hypothetical protein
MIIMKKIVRSIILVLFVLFFFGFLIASGISYVKGQFSEITGCYQDHIKLSNISYTNNCLNVSFKACPGVLLLQNTCEQITLNLDQLSNCNFDEYKEIYNEKDIVITEEQVSVVKNGLFFFPPKCIIKSNKERWEIALDEGTIIEGKVEFLEKPIAFFWSKMFLIIALVNLILLITLLKFTKNEKS